MVHTATYKLGLHVHVYGIMRRIHHNMQRSVEHICDTYIYVPQKAVIIIYRETM